MTLVYHNVIIQGLGYLGALQNFQYPPYLCYQTKTTTILRIDCLPLLMSIFSLLDREDLYGGFQKIRGPFSGIPMIRIIALGVYQGFPMFMETTGLTLYIDPASI